MASTNDKEGGFSFKNIFQKKTFEEGSIESVLVNVPAFSDLAYRELKSVASIVHRREYTPGEYVVYEEDPGLGMYVIEKGEVAILMTDQKGKEKELAILKGGDFFGDLALLDESPRSASAIAKTECKLIGFFRPDLFGLMEKSPQTGIKIILKIAAMIGERLRQADQEITKLKNELERLKEIPERSPTQVK